MRPSHAPEVPEVPEVPVARPALRLRGRAAGTILLDVAPAGLARAKTVPPPGGRPARVRTEPQLNIPPLFPLGAIVATASAVAEIPLVSIHAALDRHAAGDWGTLCEEDRLANERALNEGERLLSAYEAAGGATFWIVTERDRSVTTVLLPEDY